MCADCEKHDGKAVPSERPVKMSSRLEGLVDIAIETPLRPGVFMIDPTALRMLLLELVRSMNQTGDGSVSTLRVRSNVLGYSLSGLSLSLLILMPSISAIHRQILILGIESAEK